uniref:Uncharacterized protein n=1 Tax=Helianthus annuus TaxID=4232 RepID=A0A251UWW0_HELAN
MRSRVATVAVSSCHAVVSSRNRCGLELFRVAMLVSTCSRADSDISGQFVLCIRPILGNNQ